MTSKKLKVAGEVDAWCTSCRMVLNHRIISMDGAKPHQVECLTCRKSHRYRAAEPGTKSTATKAPASSASSSGPRSSASPSAPRKTLAAARAEQARVSHAKEWEGYVSGRPASDFVQYTISGMYPAGTMVRHKTFGEGVVLRQIDLQKIEVMFAEENRTLAQGLILG